MTDSDDAQLLRRFVDDHAPDAFTELVRRHIDLVYFAALRRVGNDAHLADDVTQSVFIALSRKAGSLLGRSTLTGWLYTSTRFAAAQAVRAAQRRRAHEHEAHTMHELNSAPLLEWTRLRPVIDDALDELSDREREIVLLRFFENRPLAEIGSRLSLSPDAARMRVDRALDKLRGLLAKRGIASTSAALATAFTTQSGLAAPTALLATTVAAVLRRAGTAAATATTSIWKIVGGVTVVTIGIGFGLADRPSAETTANDILAGTESVYERDSPAAPAASVTPAADEPQTTAPLPQISTTPATTPPQTRSFASLSIMEKRILKRLWDHQQLSPDSPSSHWGFKLAPSSPKFAAFESSAGRLYSLGLVGFGAKTGIVVLTEKGLAYCRRNERLIDEVVLPSAD